jgi:prepilin signal peptidase PulO-like enzyme (type II secretory pathway)
LSIVVALWWVGFWAAVGLALGSFLNVVIYRIPRDQSICDPVWSACPYCGRRIRWYDNLPIVSFFRLGGRCRDCGAPISTRYLVVEALTAIVVLLLLDAFFIGHVRAGFRPTPFGVTDGLASDWPPFLAHVALFACLLAMSAIDIEHYWIDVRFTHHVIVFGFVMQALWTPRHSVGWHRPWDTTAVVSIFALMGAGLAWLVWVCTRDPDTESADDEDELRAPLEGETGDGVSLPAPPATGSGGYPPRRVRLGGWFLCVVLVAQATVLVAVSGAGWTVPYWLRAVPLLGLLAGMIVLEGRVVRPADQEIVDALEEERPAARRTVLRELAVLLPAVLFGGVGLWLVSGVGDVGERMSRVLHAGVEVRSIPLFRGWEPAFGLATAAGGLVISAAVGWGVRIFFTLLLGKEAFGVGDIHMMAAAGCVAGWPVVVLGFTLSCLLAIGGWLAALPWKSARAIPLGPWLSLGFLVVAVFYDWIVAWPVVARVIEAVDLLVVRRPWG